MKAELVVSSSGYIFNGAAVR